jgi:hypothetical protein
MSSNQVSPAEKIAAQKTLVLVTRHVGDALPPFCTWLMAGSGAALSLVVANIETVSKFIEVPHIRFALVVFLISLVFAVLATYISTMVKASIAAQTESEALGKEIAETSKQFSVLLYMAEYERGLLPPIRWIAHSAMKKAMLGDITAGARMIAKLSQIQALLVACQSLLALVALGGLAFGIKMQ